MERFISWSGGKDSTASIILCYENGIHIDGVVMCEVMFDHSRNISGEDPIQIEWIYNTAIPIIEKQFGYKVIIVKSKSDYLQEFNHVIQNSKNPERNGKKVGFLLSGMCAANSKLKMRPLSNFFKHHRPYEQIVGIAADEPERLERLKHKRKKNRRSVLAEFGIEEAQTFDICRKYNLLSPIYDNNLRTGCWFCPDQSEPKWAKLKKEHPELWEELKKLSKTPNLASKYFRYTKTFEEVEKRVDEINSQITIFDILEDKQ